MKTFQDEEFSLVSLARVRQDKNSDNIDTSPTLPLPSQSPPSAESPLLFKSSLHATGIEDAEYLQSAFQTFAPESVRHCPVARSSLRGRRSFKDLINALELDIDIGLDVNCDLGIDEGDDGSLYALFRRAPKPMATPKSAGFPPASMDWDDGWATDDSIEMVQRMIFGEAVHDAYSAEEQDDSAKEEEDSFFDEMEGCVDALSLDSPVQQGDADMLVPWMPPVSSRMFFFASDSSSEEWSGSEFDADDDLGDDQEPGVDGGGEEGTDDEDELCGSEDWPARATSTGGKTRPVVI